MKRGAQTPETFALLNLKIGESFFTTKGDAGISSLAQYHGLRVKTERYKAIGVISNKVEELVKVTLIEQWNESKTWINAEDRLPMKGESIEGIWKNGKSEQCYYHHDGSNPLLTWRPVRKVKT